MSLDTAPAELETPHRSRYVGDDDYLSGSHFQKSRAVWIGVLALAVLVFNIVEVIRLVHLSHVPNDVIGYADGYFFRPTMGPLAATNTDYLPQFRDTVTTLFLRTEKGSLPELDEFVGPGVKDFVDAKYTLMKNRYPAGFLQNFVVIEERVVSMSITGGAVMAYRGIWTIRSAKGMATQGIAVRATFNLGAPAPHNATGWRLMSISPLTTDQFYADERAAAHAERLGLDPKGAATK